MTSSQETYMPRSLFCDIGKTMATLNIDGGEIEDNAKGFVESICSGCARWSEESVQQTDAEIEAEWPGHVHHGRINILEQHLVDRSRFRGGESRIVVGTCGLLGIE